MHDLQLNLAGLEAVCRQCPPEYRTCTCFHVRRIAVDMEKITEEVHRLLRRMSATERRAGHYDEWYKSRLYLYSQFNR